MAKKTNVSAKDSFNSNDLASLVGSITEGYGAIQEGNQTADAFSFNAYGNEQDALSIERSGEFKLHRAKTGARMLLARQVAATAASGRSYSGSALDVMARSERSALMDQEIIQGNTLRAAANKRAKAIMNKAAARNAVTAGYTKAFVGALQSSFAASSASAEGVKKG